MIAQVLAWLVVVGVCVLCFAGLRDGHNWRAEAVVAISTVVALLAAIVLAIMVIGGAS